MSISSPKALLTGINHRLTESRENLRSQFAERAHGHTRVAWVDGLLDSATAEQIASRLPSLEKMVPRRSFRECKYTSNRMNELDPMVGQVCFALQDPDLIAQIELITGIKNLLPDPTLYASGISAMAKGDFLSPHIDNSHDASLSLYRRINLLFYLTPNWTEEKGGHLQLWDPDLKTKQIYHSSFNRLVVMETNRTSYHSVSSVLAHGPRYCVSSYLFTKESPEEHDYYHITSFSAPPNELFKRAVFGIDTWLRSQVRRFKKEGIVKPELNKTGPT